MIGSQDSAALRLEEEQLLRRALLRAKVWRVHVPGHEWADVLPGIMAGDTTGALQSIQISPEPTMLSEGSGAITAADAQLNSPQPGVAAD